MFHVERPRSGAGQPSRMGTVFHVEGGREAGSFFPAEPLFHVEQPPAVDGRLARATGGPEVRTPSGIGRWHRAPMRTSVSELPERPTWRAGILERQPQRRRQHPHRHGGDRSTWNIHGLPFDDPALCS